jgi:hypothetical protein
MRIETNTVDISRRRSDERGAALIMALMVSLILVFLGMGLLLQTSLGLQAAGTDRWVTKALYAADAGAMMQIEMIQLGALFAEASAKGSRRRRSSPTVCRRPSPSSRPGTSTCARKPSAPSVVSPASPMLRWRPMSRPSRSWKNSSYP